MPDRRRWGPKEILKLVVLALVLGLAGGYAVFYGLFPLAGIPAAGEASLPFLLAILIATSVLVGLATEDLDRIIFQSFLALFLSGAFATAMALSPALVGVAFISPDSVPAFLIHYGFLLFALGFLVDLVGGTVGLALRERYFFRGVRAAPPSWERK